MKKILFPFVIVFLYLNSSIYANSVVCPQTISCVFDSGICNVTDDWIQVSYLATKPFSDNQSISLSQISGFKDLEKKSYTISCSYKYGNGNFENITISHRVKKLSSGINWIFSGFGKNRAECSDISNPEECSGEI